MKKLITLLILNVLLYQSYGQTKESITKNLIKDLEEIYAQEHIIGFTVAIVNQNGTLFEKGFGYADKKANKKYTENTIQNIASISKTFIGVALLKAQELGKLNLDDPINEHLPFEVINPYFPDMPITIRQLATHTSGIKDPLLRYWSKVYVLKEKNGGKGTVKRFWFRSPDKMMTYNTFLENLLCTEGKWYRKRNFTKTKPGEIHKYSNVGSGLAALVIENATGESFSEFTKTHILDPLKMSHSGWSFEAIDFANHSNLYSKKGKKLAFYRNVNYPDGGLITSSSDLVKYLTELILGYSGKGKTLTPESYIELFKPQLVVKSGYNNGIFMEIPTSDLIGHTGYDVGVLTHMFFNPQTKIGKIVFVNTALRGKGKKEFIEIWKTLEKHENKL